jgi:hypothetical protein
MGNPGEPRVDLTGLDEVGWASLEHAYGTADDVGDRIRLIAEGGDQMARRLDELLSDLVHQGDIYSSAAAAMPYVVRLVASGLFDGRSRTGECLFVLWAADQATNSRINGYRFQWEDEVHAAIGGEVALLLARWPTEPAATRVVLAGLAAVYPQQGSAIAGEIASLAIESSRVWTCPYLHLAHALVAGDDRRAGELAFKIAEGNDDLDLDWLHDSPSVSVAQRAQHLLTEGIVGRTSDLLGCSLH